MVWVKMLFSDHGRVYGRELALDLPKLFMYKTALLAESRLVVDVGFGNETLIHIERLA